MRSISPNYPASVVFTEELVRRVKNLKVVRINSWDIGEKHNRKGICELEVSAVACMACRCASSYFSQAFDYLTVRVYDSEDGRRRSFIG